MGCVRRDSRAALRSTARLTASAASLGVQVDEVDGRLDGMAILPTIGELDHNNLTII